MIQPEQLQQDIAALPETAQVLVADFVAFLKQRYTPAPTAPVPTPPIADMEQAHADKIAGILGQLAEANPFQAVTDPVAWQQQQRADRRLPSRDL